jgi:hypothetical protein
MRRFGGPHSRHEKQKPRVWTKPAFRGAHDWHHIERSADRHKVHNGIPLSDHQSDIYMSVQITLPPRGYRTACKIEPTSAPSAQEPPGERC